MSHTAARLAAALAVVAALAAPAAAAAWEIAPHRAIYELEIASVRMGSQVSDVGGQMLFQWTDSCDGWTVEQRYRMTYVFAEGGELDQRMAYSTWESKDGHDFNFSVRNATGAEVDEEFRGAASVARDGSGRAEYRLPDGHEEVLPSGTMFPSAHTIRLLEEAEAGGQLFVAKLFDGTDIDSLSEISAFVGRQHSSQNSEHALLDRPSWTVDMAFFPNSDPSPLPDYEMSVTLYDNGVIDSMLIDYGDFTVRATLAELEALDRPDCP